MAAKLSCSATGVSRGSEAGPLPLVPRPLPPRVLLASALALAALALASCAGEPISAPGFGMAHSGAVSCSLHPRPVLVADPYCRLQHPDQCCPLRRRTTNPVSAS